MQRIFLAPILFWCLSIMTAFGLPPRKQEFTELIQMDNQDEAERRLNALLSYRSNEETVDLMRWFTTPMDERQFSFPSFLSIASGNQRLTLLLIERMAGIIVWSPHSKDFLHTLINTNLFYSVSTGYLERVVLLLDQHKDHIKILDHNANSLLSYAVQYGHNDIIRFLMQGGLTPYASELCGSGGIFEEKPPYGHIADNGRRPFAMIIRFLMQRGLPIIPAVAETTLCIWQCITTKLQQYACFYL